MQDEESSIERLKRNLYSRNQRIVPKDKRTPVQPHEMDVPTSWGTQPNFNVTSEEMVKKNNSFFNKFLVGSLVFFLISLSIALFIFFGGLNMISSNNVDIRITAPSSVSSGEEMLIALSVVNTNRSDLQDAVLYIDYPEGAQAVTPDDKPLTHEKASLGTIAKGGTSDYTIRALVFGEKDTVKSFKFKIEYKVKGSNAIFSKEKTYEVGIGSSPILLNVDYPKEVNSGQTLTLSIDVTSNSSVPLKNTLVKVEYPYGFTYKSSNMKPLSNNAVWNIGDLKNGDKKTLTVSGVLIGQNLEDRSFRVSSGVQTPAKNDFDTMLADDTITIGIRKSFFDLAVFAQGGAVARVGDAVPVNIQYRNTLPDKIVNAHVEAVVSGNALDRNKVYVGNGGYFQSVNNTLVWDKNGTNALTSISPGDQNQLSFSLISLSDPNTIRQIKNPHIDIHVTMTGDRTGSDAATISSTDDLTIKINSMVNVIAKSVRNQGPFTNTGSIPPRADKESTYTIVWTLTNTTNDLKETQVSATLPPGVVWKNQISPTNENLKYDADSRTVTWNIGNVSSGVGFSYSPKEVSFQVGITPSVNQVGLVPFLVSEARVSASDTYTEKLLTTSAPGVTTHFADPNFVQGMDIVGK